MTADDVRRAVTRIGHEIVERNRGGDGVVLVAVQTGGVWLAEQLASVIGGIEGGPVPWGCLDVSMYRDDIGLRPVVPGAVTRLPRELTGTTVVVVDDVLYTGLTFRAA